MIEIVNEYGNCYVGLACCVVESGLLESPDNGFQDVIRQTLCRLSVSKETCRSIPEDFRNLFQYIPSVHPSGASGFGSLCELLGSELAGTNSQSDSRGLVDKALLTPILLQCALNTRWSPLDRACWPSDATYQAFVQICQRVDIVELSDSVLCWNSVGRYLIEKSMINALPVSYAPLWFSLRDLAFGITDCLRPGSNGCERHVDRELNVISSGFQHGRFFEDMVAAFAESGSTSELPAYVADTGCGDGSLLKKFLLDGSLNRTIRPIAIDLNEAALRVSSETLAEWNPLLISGDVAQPVAIERKLLESGVDKDDVLHIRSFLDHDRRFEQPSNLSECDRWKQVGSAATVLTDAGERIPASEVLLSLSQHFCNWRAICGKHGLLAFEVHSSAGALTEDIHQSNAVYFEAIHSVTGQQLVEPQNYLLCAASAGLISDPAQLKCYPRKQQRKQISLHWFKPSNYRIVPAIAADFHRVFELETKVWGELTPNSAEILRRIDHSPTGVFLLEQINSGELVGAVTTQKIQSIEQLLDCDYNNLSNLRDDNGQVLQLISLTIDSNRQDEGLGSILLNFVLNYVRLSGTIKEIAGLSRCRTATAESLAEYERYVFASDEQDAPVDPILKFHHTHGARVERVVQGFREPDSANLGCGVLIRYSPSDVLPIIRTQDSTTVDVANEIKSLLGPNRLKDFDVDRALLDMGLDSLDLQDLRATLCSQTGLSLDAGFFFAHPTPRQIEAALHKAGNANATKRSTSPLIPALKSTAYRNRDLDMNSVETSMLHSTSDEPIAIVGMGCRFPGANNIQEFWQLLIQGRCAVREVPQDRWNIEELYDPNPDAPGKMWSRQGGFIDRVDKFDAAFFGISPREAKMMDPQQRLLLETTWQALEEANIPPRSLEGSRTGVFLGISSNDYSREVFRNREQIDAYCATGTFFSTAAGRTSFVLGFKGPCLAVDTACSSSLVALHLAIQSLTRRESELSLCAGVNVLFPEAGINFTKARMLSPNGFCKTFDASADGYVRGEGCGVVVLKRLSDAVRDGNHIHAVVRGTATNQDGRSNGLTAPNGHSQQDLLRELLASSKVSPDQVTYVEAHGTGTSLGDPIEANALIQVLRRDNQSNCPLFLGSVKTNIGHLESASGVAAIIKSALTLQNRTIPPHLHFEKLNPEIDATNVALCIPTASHPLAQQDTPHIVSVSSFGFGGTNAMALLESYDCSNNLSNDSTETPHLICISGKTEKSLGRQVGAWTQYLANGTNNIAGAAGASQRAREHFPFRKAVVGRSSEELLDRLLAQSAVAKHQNNRLAFMFTGQGAQYARMGAELARHNPILRRTIEHCLELGNDGLPSDFRAVWLDSDTSASRIHETAYTQPALFILEYALAQMWIAAGTKPDCVLGHSIGELTAACVAGVLPLQDMLSIVCRRAALIDSLPRDGGMAAVLAEESTVRSALSGCQRISIAAVNGTQNTVISGCKEELQSVLAQLNSLGISAKPLTVSHAFHSPLLNSIADEFEEYCSQFSFATPTIPLISNVTGKLFIPSSAMDAQYLRNHLLGTVRFADVVRTAMDLTIDTYIECGPGNTLCGLGKRIALSQETLNNSHWYHTLSPGSEVETLLTTAGRLYEGGCSIDWHALEVSDARFARIPHYEFEQHRYWLDNNRATEGETLDSQGRDGSSAWTQVETPHGEVHGWLDISIENTPDLFEHRIRDRALFPAAGYAAVAIEFARGLGTDSLRTAENLEWSLADATIEAPFSLNRNHPQTLYATATKVGEAEWQFECHYRRSEDIDRKWTRCFTATLAARSATLELVFTPPASQHSVCSGEVFYQDIAKHGYHYGPSFQKLTAVHCSDSVCEGSITSLDGYNAAPAERILSLTRMLDASAHTTLLLRPSSSGNADLWVPVGWAELIWAADRSLNVNHVRATINNREAAAMECELKLGCGEVLTMVWRKTRLTQVQSPKSSDQVETSEHFPAPDLNAMDSDSLAPNKESYEALLATLQEKMHYILMYESDEVVSVDATFAQLGMDSIMATELELEVEAIVGRPLAAGSLNNLANLRALCEHILKLRDSEVSVES